MESVNKGPVPAEKVRAMVAGYELALQVTRRERNDLRIGYEASRNNFLSLAENAKRLMRENESLQKKIAYCQARSRDAKCHLEHEEKCVGIILPPGMSK